MNETNVDMIMAMKNPIAAALQNVFENDPDVALKINDHAALRANLIDHTITQMNINKIVAEIIIKHQTE